MNAVKQGAAVNGGCVAARLASKPAHSLRGIATNRLSPQALKLSGDRASDEVIADLHTMQRPRPICSGVGLTPRDTAPVGRGARVALTARVNTKGRRRMLYVR